MHRGLAIRPGIAGRLLQARWPGRLLALLALAVQLAAASVVPLAAASAATPDALVAATICHSGGPAASGGQAPAHHSSHDCALCPLCQTLAQAGVVLGASPAALPLPPVLASRAAALPPVRAPPARLTDAAPWPRGPPAIA